MGKRSEPYIIPLAFGPSDATTTDHSAGFVASCTGEVVASKVMLDGGFNANTTNYCKFLLYDGGAIGTGTAVIASRGGKSTDYTALQWYNILTEGATPHKLDKGDACYLKYDETGTVSPGTISASVWFVPGLQD